MNRTVFILPLLFLFVSFAAADTSVTILKGEAVGEMEAALYLSAVDDAGRPLKGLTAREFRLAVGGEPITAFTLEPISTTDEALSIILVVDVSGSMKGQPFYETQKAISIFLDELEKEDFISLVSFGSEIRSLTEFIHEKYIIREKLQGLQPVEMWTHLYDVTYETLELAKNAPTTRTAIVLLSDGKDEGSKKTREEALAIAKGSSVPVFTIGFGQDVDVEYLDDLAKISGAVYASTPKPENISVLYNEVLDHLRNQYRIRFPFDKEPSTYKAALTMSHSGVTSTSTKQFLFNPAGTPVVVTTRGGEFYKPWFSDLTRRQRLILGGFLLAVMIVVIFFLLLLFRRKKKKRFEEEERRKNEIKAILERLDTEECELEYPSEFPTAVHYVDAKSSLTTSIRLLSQEVLLKTDCLDKPIPLIYEGVEVLEEIYIAKKSEKRASFRKPGIVYLWTKNNFVSRASEDRFGHARIFLSKGGRFAVEDLGSKNGTWVKGKRIAGTLPLQHGDVIEIGGNQGLRITYIEGKSDADNSDGTIIQG